MDNIRNNIDLFTQGIIRRQFAIISALTVEPYDDDFNFEQTAILLTAIQDRFDYIIHRGIGDSTNSGYPPICFTVLNNTKDGVSNKHWEKTMLNFARNGNQCGLIVGYDDVVLTDPLRSCGGQALVYGTIKLLKAECPPSRTTKSRAIYANQSREIITSYAELLSVYGTLLGGNSSIRFSVDEPFVKYECAHKTQPVLTTKNISNYYEKHKYFDSFYSNGYYDFKSSPVALSRAKEQLKRLLVEPY